MADWKIANSTKRCSKCEKEFSEDQIYFSGLVEQSDTFNRDDFCETCWSETDKDWFFSFWKTRLPGAGEEPKKKLVDTSVIYLFFTRLEATQNPQKLLFRYLLCLILVRKRYLRLDGFNKQETGEYLDIWDRKAEKCLQVLNPEATPEELSIVQDKLSFIFDMPEGNAEEQDLLPT